jgi:hypothetical protein
VSTLDYFLPSSHDKHHRKLQDIAQQCNEFCRRNVFWRFFQRGVDQNSLSGIKQDLQNAVAEFQVPYFIGNLAILC